MLIMFLFILFVIVSYMSFNAIQKKYSEKIQVLNIQKDNKLKEKQEILQKSIQTSEQLMDEFQQSQKAKTTHEIEDFWNKQNN